ncbi:hypothetical protein CEP50_17385 [Actinopolyspora mortivallis]|uniref:Uncharacterized protein n=1 Tax=Actinopolyspora mortivallis TaxID=33906 RepID=A0A2T0GSI2_ACTMO|nr:hypothetical protein CEP50_17385 [Actinopolyspora mortivallis]
MRQVDFEVAETDYVFGADSHTEMLAGITGLGAPCGRGEGPRDRRGLVKVNPGVFRGERLRLCR